MFTQIRNQLLANDVKTYYVIRIHYYVDKTAAISHGSNANVSDLTHNIAGTIGELHDKFRCIIKVW